jgi:hypothetical protein
MAHKQCYVKKWGCPNIPVSGPLFSLKADFLRSAKDPKYLLNYLFLIKKSKNQYFSHISKYENKSLK